MDLSPTAYVVLGMLRHEPRSGYEIKRAVDQSTRFFWAASYGQIYPELRRLEQARLGRGHGGAARRAPADRLRAHRAPGATSCAAGSTRGPRCSRLRDEGLLKLFFAAAGPEAAIEIIDAKQRLHEAEARRA